MFSEIWRKCRNHSLIFTLPYITPFPPSYSSSSFRDGRGGRLLIFSRGSRFFFFCFNVLVNVTIRFGWLLFYFDQQSAMHRWFYEAFGLSFFVLSRLLQAQRNGTDQIETKIRDRNISLRKKIMSPKGDIPFAFNIGYQPLCGVISTCTQLTRRERKRTACSRFIAESLSLSLFNIVLCTFD